MVLGSFFYIVRQPCVCPPGVYLQIRRKQKLTIPINRAFCDLIIGSDGRLLDGSVFGLPGDIPPVASDIDHLSFSWGRNLYREYKVV
jgi:hypothetical protein